MLSLWKLLKNFGDQFSDYSIVFIVPLLYLNYGLKIDETYFDQPAFPILFFESIDKIRFTFYAKAIKRFPKCQARILTCV